MIFRSVLCVIVLFNCTQCANIIAIFNGPSKSNTILSVKLAEGLIKRGHRVTIVSPHTSEPIAGLTQIKLKKLYEQIEREHEKRNNPSISPFRIMTMIKKYFKKASILFWKDQEIQKIIKERPKYDVMISTMYDASVGLAHHLGVANIFFSPFGSNNMNNFYVGNPNMVYVPNMMFSASSNTFFGRLYTVTANIALQLFMELFIYPAERELLMKYLPESPPLEDLQKNVSLLLLNSHYSIEPPRPHVPNAIQIGGFHLDQTKELPQEIKAYLDSAQQGAILFSLGSNVRIAKLDEDKLRTIFKVLGELAPIKVIFKSEIEHKNLPENILVKKWLPQADILAHPNVRAFISHGGLGGNTETVYHGVPIVGIPFFGDQQLNIQKAEEAGYAVSLKYEHLDEDLFRTKLKEILENPRYRLPPHEALLRSITQDGFHSTAEYIRQLITYQEYVRKLHGPDTSVWSKPRLMERMDILNQLKEGLHKAEKANRAENTGVELTELLKLAVRFAFGDQNWLWLGHQLLEQALTISRVYMRDGGMHHAIARYAYGKFLMESNMEAALEHLNVARSMSVGTSWTARFIFPTYQNIMFTEVSILIHQILLKKAKNCIKKDPHLAIKLSILAEKAALDGCHFSGQTEAQIVKGECEQLIYDTSSAITSFRKALAIQNSHETPKWRAETLSHLAIAYLKHGDLTSALQKLNELKQYALEHDLKFYLAQAYKYLGEYYLREGTPQNSTPLLRKALKLFHEENHILESENARNYAAISIGIELMNPYIQLIVNCVNTNPNYEYLMKTLLAWKESRENFWSYGDYEVSFNAINDTMDEDFEIDLMDLPKSDEKMVNEEMFLSILSLVDSKESYRALALRQAQESMDRMEEMHDMDEELVAEINVEDNSGEAVEDEEVEESSWIEEDPKQIVTLHFSQGYQDD